MTIVEFEDAIGRLGEDLSTWPFSLRADALALLHSSPEARVILDETRDLRRAFSEAKPILAPAGLAARIALKASATSEPALPAPAVHVLRTPPAPGLRARLLDVFRDVIARPGLPSAALILSCFLMGVGFSNLVGSTASQATPLYVSTVYVPFVR